MELGEYRANDPTAVSSASKPTFRVFRGLLWITAHSELICFDPESKMVQYFTAHDPAIKGSNFITSGHDFYQDSRGNYWLGAIRYGLVRFIPSMQPNRNPTERLLGIVASRSTHPW